MSVFSTSCLFNADLSESAKERENVCVYTCASVHMMLEVVQVCVHTCVHTCMCVHVPAFVRVRVCVCVCVGGWDQKKSV